MEKMFFTKPIPASSLYHVFKGKDRRSLCGNYGMILLDPEMITEVKGTEKYTKGQDCKSCFKKANLGVN